MSELGQFYPDNLIGGDKKLVTESVTILSGENLKRGTALGRVKVVVPTTGTVGTNTGDGTVTAVSGGNKTAPGTYSIVCTRAVTNGGEFSVSGPNGFVGNVLITAGAGGTGVFSSDEINFTVTDGGSADFAVADSFTVAVTAGVPAIGTAGSNTGNGTVTGVKSGRSLKAGVYGVECIEAAANSGKFEITDPDGNSLGTVYARMFSGTGNGTITEIKHGRLKKPGRYVVTCTGTATDGGTFRVTDPDGNVVGDVTLPGTSGGSVRFVSDEISFLLTDGGTDFAAADVFRIDSFESDQISLVVNDGSTDFIVGDDFTITVTVGARDCKMVNSDNTDGSGEVFAILAEDIDASVASKVAAAYLEGQFVESQLIFGGDDTVETHRAQMRDVGIIAVDSVRAAVHY
jgi:hypothetical protein